MLLPFKNWLLNVLVSLVEFERVILLGSTSAGQEIIYPVGGRWSVWVGAFSRWVGGRSPQPPAAQILHTITTSKITLIYHVTWYGTCDYVTPKRGYLGPTNLITDTSLKPYRSDSSNNNNHY